MKQRLKSAPDSLDNRIEFLPDIKFTEISYDSIDFEEYDNKPFNKWVDRVVAVSTGLIIGVGMADLYPESMPESVIGQMGLAVLIEQAINGVQVVNHYVRPDGRTFKQRLKRSFRDDPYRVAGIYIGQLAVRAMMY